MITLILAVAGCSSLTQKDDKATAPSSETTTAVAAQYYDFGDVLVPKELKVNKKHLLFTKLAVLLPVYWF